MKFSAKIQDNKIIIENKSGKPLLVKELRIFIKTTVITPEERFAVRKISDEMRLNMTLTPNSSIEVRTYYTNVVGVSIIYEEDGQLLREDHEV
ncbi:MAG: hypothetical protein L7H21_00210 [Sulfolobales archaeon]|nr:hypothetical protein [Sulfolobales archaeon]MCG2893538.1 hypothetical protein [Sulfolobales archaeon]MCG2910066.1 hypothetical protein [Sulfolobales archaeon]